MENDRRLKVRSYCFTIWQTKTSPRLGQGLRYISWQKEKCPDSGKEHFQLYVELDRPIRGTRVATLLGYKDGEYWFRARRGTREQARDYTRKEDTRTAGPWELGRWIRGRGDRSDLKAFWEDFQGHRDVLTSVERHPGPTLKYLRSVRHLAMRMRRLRGLCFRHVKVSVYWGEPGVGKSRRILYHRKTSRPRSSVYVWTPFAAPYWFDGYDEQRTLYICEFYGNIPFRLLLQLLDGHQLRLPVKGGHAYALWKRVKICSNQHPSEWYKCISDVQRQALNRRITEIYHCTADGFQREN